MKKVLVLASAAALVLTGCQQEPTVGVNDGAAVEFTSDIDGRNTRAGDTAWDAGDGIGVYMLTAGETLPSGTVLGTPNALYTSATVDGNFAATGENILYYPGEGASVDFVAYYPHKATITDLKVPVDVADQTVRAAVELLYATSTGNTAGAPTLSFTHKLSKIVFKVTDLDDATGASLAGLTTTLTGLDTTGALDLANGTVTADDSKAPIVAKLMGVTGNVATVEAIVLPEAGNFTVGFKLADNSTATSTTITKTFAPNTSYTYTVNLKSQTEPLEDVVITAESFGDYNDGGNENLNDIEKDEDVVPATPAIEDEDFEVTGNDAPFTATGGTFSIGYTVTNPIEGENVAPTVSAGAEAWITILPATRAATNTINIEVEANTTTEPRTGTVTLMYNGQSLKTITVDQEAKEEEPDNSLFPGADFESGMPSDYIGGAATGQALSIVADGGMDGSDGLSVKGVSTGNGNAFTLTLPSTSTAGQVLSFYIKGSGSAKAIAIRDDTDTNKGYNLSGLSSGDMAITTKANSLNYGSAFNTGVNWRKVSLTLIAGVKFLEFRVGKESTYDVVYDSFTIE